MLINVKKFENQFFDSYADFLEGKYIENPFNFAIHCSDNDLDKVADYLIELYSKIPESYYKNFKIDISNFYLDNKQLSFPSIEVLNKITKLLATKRSKFVSNLAILSCFDYSFLQYIIGENPNYKPNADTFKKSTDEVDSTYYSNITKFKITLLRNLESIDSDRDVESFLYRNTDMAVACGLKPDCIPDHSIISRFRADYLSPLKSIAIFYFIVLVAITNEIGSNIHCATDSTHIFSYANTYNRYNTCNCKFRSDCCPTCTYDINASVGHKKKDFSFFGYKVHTTVDAVSRLILGFFFSPGSANDSPIYIPLQKFVHKILSVKFDVYSADKGYDSTKNNSFIVNDLEANPVIPCREMEKKSNSDVVFYKNGAPHCKHCKLQFRPNGKDLKAGFQLWNCPNTSKRFTCEFIELCNPTSKELIRTHKTPLDDIRKNGTQALPKHSEAWKKAYNLRVIIEQVFSELKLSFSLDNLNFFKLSSIFSYVCCSLIAYNLTVLVKELIIK